MLGRAAAHAAAAAEGVAAVVDGAIEAAEAADGIGAAIGIGEVSIRSHNAATDMGDRRDVPEAGGLGALEAAVEVKIIHMKSKIMDMRDLKE